MARGLGKKIHTWTMKGDASTFTVTVYMDAGVETIFSATCEALDIRERDKDINKLESTMKKAVKSKSSTQWVKWILVRSDYGFSDPKPPDSILFDQSATDASVKLFWEFVEIGTDHEGATVHRMCNTSMYGSRPRKGLPNTEAAVECGSRNARLDDDAKAMSLIPFTTENLAALEVIRVAIKTLGFQLASLLSPNPIEKTLEHVRTSGIQLLRLGTTKGDLQ